MNISGGLKRIICLVMSIGICVMGCAKSDTENGSQNDENEQLEIGMSFDSFVIERWQKDRDVFTATATELGATVNVQNANGDVAKQLEQIEYLIDRGVDCLVIIPIDAEALGDVCEKAHERGIPVVCYDRIITNAQTDLYVSFDNESVGRMMGSAIAETGARKVVMICGPLTDKNVPMVKSGFCGVMEENNIEVVDEYYCENWKAELGGAYVYDNMDTILGVDAIMCGNDDVASSVIRALAVSKLAGRIPVVGQDADLPACQHIVEGTQTMTVYKPVNSLASEAAKLSVALANGDAIDVSSTINDGTYEIPYFTIEPIAVTNDNIDEVIIGGGYHTREDVYLNVTQ